MMKHQLFHRIADPASAAIRRLVMDLGLKDQIDFRNVDLSDSAREDFEGYNGKEIPAIWTGDELFEGEADITKYLHSASAEPFPELLDRFDTIAAEVWTELRSLIPSEFQPAIGQIEFLIMDEPDDALVADLEEEMAEHPETICGLHVGIPVTQALLTDPPLDPVKVYLFRWALIDMIDPDDSDPERTLREEIAVTLLHEIGHYFGLEEDDLDRLGYG